MTLSIEEPVRMLTVIPSPLLLRILFEKKGPKVLILQAKHTGPGDQFYRWATYGEEGLSVMILTPVTSFGLLFIEPILTLLF